MQPPDFTRHPAPVARRTVLAGAGATAVALTAGCNNPFSSAPTTRIVEVQAPPPIDPMDQLIAMTRLHLLRLEALVTVGGGTATKYTPLRNDRKAHLTRLLQEQAKTNRTTPAPLTLPGEKIDAPGNPASLTSKVVEDAADAQSAFSDQIGVVSQYRATLFASIAACLSSHRVVLR